TIVHKSRKKTGCFVNEFSDRKRTGNVIAVSINVYVIKVLSVIDAVWKYPKLKFVVNEWDTWNWLLLFHIFGILKAFQAEWVLCWICLHEHWKKLSILLHTSLQMQVIHRLIKSNCYLKRNTVRTMISMVNHSKPKWVQKQFE